MSLAVADAASGSRKTVMALGSPPPQLGRVSRSSCRARHSSTMGPSAQRARKSRNESMPSSAQWMSSMTSTRGLGGDGAEVAAPGLEELVPGTLALLADCQHGLEGIADGRARRRR